MVGKPEPNFAGHHCQLHHAAVQGFGEVIPAKITKVTDVTIQFAGKAKELPLSISGNINRVTGDVEATETAYESTSLSKITATGEYVHRANPKYSAQMFRLYDINDNKEYGSFYQRSDSNIPMDCQVLGQAMFFGRGMELLISPYMEDAQ
jgi:hypothetical protein